MSIRPVQQPDKEARAFMRKEAWAVFRKLFPHEKISAHPLTVQVIRQALKDAHASGLCFGMLSMMKAAKVDADRRKKKKPRFPGLPGFGENPLE
jgi:hypothetical protein